MKKVNNSILRSAFAMILGFVLVLWPEAAVTYLVIAIGICFILPGIFSLLSYFTREKVEGEPSPMFPIDGAGSIRSMAGDYAGVFCEYINVYTGSFTGYSRSPANHNAGFGT